MKFDLFNPNLPKDSEKALFAIISRIGLRKAIHFFSQALSQYNSFKNSRENLALNSVFLWTLCKEKLLEKTEALNFRYYLKSLPFFELIRCDYSFENFEKSEGNQNSDDFARFSPIKLSSFSQKKINLKVRKSPILDSIQKNVFIFEEYKENESSSSSCKPKKRVSQRLIPLKSFVRILTPMNNDLSLTWNYASTYTLESMEKSPISGENQACQRSFGKREKSFLVRQQSL